MTADQWVGVLLAALGVAGVAIGILWVWLKHIVDEYGKCAENYRESAKREGWWLLNFGHLAHGPLALYGPVETGAETTPLADAIDFELWKKEVEG